MRVSSFDANYPRRPPKAWCRSARDAESANRPFEFSADTASHQNALEKHGTAQTWTQVAKTHRGAREIDCRHMVHRELCFSFRNRFHPGKDFRESARKAGAIHSQVQQLRDCAPRCPAGNLARADRNATTRLARRAGAEESTAGALRGRGMGLRSARIGSRPVACHAGEWGRDRLGIDNNGICWRILRDSRRRTERLN
jgi:hypothetical protein